MSDLAPENPPRPLRIALNHTRLDSTGGVEGYISSLLERLLDQGHRVDFFGGKFLLELKHPLLRIIRIPYVRSPRPLRVASFAILSHRIIAREERKAPYDIVQGFSRTYYHTLYRDGAGCRQDYCELYLDRFARKGIRKLYYRLNPVDALVRRIERQRYVLRPQKMVIAISNFVKDQILGRYPVKPETVRVIYSGVDCMRFRPDLREKGRAAFQSLLPPAAGAPRRRRLVFAGNDYHRKGLDLILQVLSARLRGAKDGAADFSLLVAGSDERAADYERKASEMGLGARVRFLGKRQDLPEILAGADLLLLPSYFDAYANVTSEALASGTPVMVSPTSGAAEFVRPEYGWVLRRNNAEDLSRALGDFFSRSDLEPLRAQARAAALELSWERHYEEIDRAYREFVASKEKAG